MKFPFLCCVLGAFGARAAVVTSFEEEALSPSVGLDIPRPTLGNVVFDALNDELDFTAAGNTDMWTTRNNAAIAWTAVPTGLTPGSKWVVETEVRLNNVVQNGQVAGLTFYGGPDGARPDISFGLDNWDPATRAVRLQGLGDNDPNTHVPTTAARVILRVEVTEGGASDTYNFFFRETAADPWTQIPGAAVDYRTSFANARVGMTYKTATAKAGAAFTFFHVVGGSSEPPIITAQPASLTAVNGGVARFVVSELGASSIQWRRDGVPLAAGGTEAALVLDPVTPADAGAVFDCVLTNASGSTTSAPVGVTVSPLSAGGAHYASAVRAEPSLVGYFPVDGSPPGVVTNERNAGFSGLPRGPAGPDSLPDRTVGTKNLATGGTGWVSVAGDAAWEFTDGNGTIELFAYQATATAFPPGLVSLRTDAQTRYTLKADGAGTKVLLANGSTSPSWTLPASSLGRLMHLALVLHNGQATLYHNGVSLGTIAQALGPAQGGGLTIGSTGPAGQDAFPGSLDEVAIYAEPLPASAISAHYTAWLTTTPGAPPSITAQPAAKTVDEGGAATFSVSLADTTDAVYRWLRNGVDIPGATAPALTIEPVTLADDGAVIQCLVHNRHGGALSEAAVLTVNDITAPQLLAATSPLFAGQLILTFNEPVVPDGATFAVAGGTVTSSAVGPLPGQLTLTITGLSAGQASTVAVSTVRDPSGNVLPSASLAFTAAPPPVPAPIELVRPAAEPMGPATRRGPFVFSEIHYHPRDRADGKNLEFIEIYNSQPWIEDVSGCRLTGEISFTLPAGTTIPAGGRLVVAAAPEDVMSVYGLPGVLGPWSGALNNSGGQIRLRDISDAVVFSVDYDAGDPWPAAADGSGHSLVLARPSYGMEDPRSWAASLHPDGSPGAAEPSMDDPYRTVLINEIAAATGATGDFVELFNYGSLAVDLSGCSLSDDRDGGKFSIPSGTLLEPGQWLSIGQTELGFGLKSGGDTVYFRAPNGVDGAPGRVLEAIRFGAQRPGLTYGRLPDGAPVFSALAAPSAGAANAGPAAKPAVISEIHYHSPSGSTRPPFVEVANLSGAPLDLGLWRLRGGISYDFPAGTTLAAGASMAVSAFSGTLNQGIGERLRLEQPVTSTDTPLPVTEFPVVDEVTYGTGGRWGRWSDGGGSSLERTDLRSDGRAAAHWDDSDESAEAGWVTIEATGPLAAGSGSPSNRLHVFLLGAGECLVDDIEVLSSTGANLLSNGGFEGGTTGWLRQGTHDASSIESTAFSGHHAMHLRAAGRGNLAGNRLTSPLTTSLAVGSTATLRARVKWLHGHPEILLRLQGGTLEATGNILPPTANPGTPGATNSRATTNDGPAISAVTHLPLLPQTGQTATVFARLEDPDGIALARLHFRLDPAATTESLPMRSRGAGLFSAELPAQTAGKLVAFSITAHDTRGASTTFPKNGAEGLVRWGEPSPPAGALGTYRLWMTEATRNTWTTRLKNSNTPLDVTFLYGNSRVIYNASAQYSGSPWHTGGFNGPTGGPCDYDCTLPSDDRLFGDTDFLFAGPGTFGDDSSFIREQTIWWMARRLGLQSLHRRFGRLYINGVRRQTIFEDTQQPNGEWIDEYWPGDDNGRLHKAQDWIEYEDDGATFQTTLRALMEKRTRSGGQHDTAAYRFQWAPRSVAGSVNDWSDFTALVDAFNTGASATDPAFFNALDPLVDQDSWARALAIQRISGNWDTWGWRFGKNMYLYKPQRGPWAMTAWDIDFSFGLVGESASFSLFDDTQDPLCTKFRNQPAFRRAYWCAYREAVDGPMLAANVNARIDAMVAGLAANGVAANTSQVSAVKSYISSRRNYIVSQLNGAYNSVTFGLTGSSTLTDDDGVITLNGTAPPGVKSLRINGVLLTPTWTSQTAWRLPLTLYATDNSLTIEGVDRRGATLGSFPLTVTVTGPPALPPVRINEWLADNGAPGGLTDPADGQPDDWFELLNTGASPVDLGGFLLADDPASPSPFVIPTGTVLPAGGRLLVWADGQPEQNGLTVGQLHTSFRLSAAGESLRLTTPSGSVIDSVTFGPQETGVSGGRFPDGGGLEEALTLPTPGSGNALTRIHDWAWQGPVLRFTVQSTPGLTYQLEASPSLAGWAPVGVPKTADGSTVTLDDPAAPLGTSRFYRVMTRK